MHGFNGIIMSKDYYAVMGLSRNASDKDIKAAYRKLARKYHPDVNKAPDSEEKFKELGQAYEVLKDPEKRKAYDQFGPHWQQQQQQYQQQGYQHSPNEQGVPLDEDFLASLFGHDRRKSSARAGEDYHADIALSLEEAFSGVTKQITIPIPHAAHFTGRAPETKTLNIKIPAGVKEGHKIRLAGLGAPGFYSNSPGNLYLTVHLQKHPWYEVSNHDIYLVLPVAPWEAALGATIKVPTLGGLVDLKIPQNSQGGQKLRLKGRGLPGKTHGDQFILLKIVIPEVQNEKVKKLYQEMAAATSFNPRLGMGV